MTRMRCTTPAGSQGGLRVRGGAAELVGRGVRGRVFVCGADSDAEGLVRVRTMPAGAASGLCGGLSGPLMEADAVVREDCPDAVCDGGAAVGDCARFEAFSEGGCATGMRSERKTMDGKGGG